MPNKNSLALALKPWFEKPLKDLPDELRHKIERDVLLRLWDKVEPNARRGLANVFDGVNQRESERLWKKSLRRESELNEQISKLELHPAPTFSEMALKEERLSVPKAELAKVQQDQKRWIAMGDYDPTKVPISDSERGALPLEAKQPGHLNHNLQWQEQANEIAAERKKKTGKRATRDYVAKVLATKINEDEATVLRRIRRKW